MSANIKKILSALLLLTAGITLATAGPGDTIKVQTFTFGSPQDAWFDFPSADISIEKILMKYTLKCNPAQSPACGEWDYLTYTNLYEHTGNMDSTLLTHKFFLENGAGPDTFSYSITPTYTNVPSWEYHIVYDDTTALLQTIIGTNTTTVNAPLNAMYPQSRTQIIWQGADLIAAGMTAGNISGLDFNVVLSGSTIHGLTLKMKSTALTEFTADIFESGFTTVFHSDALLNTGWSGVDFTSPFYWDGVSNIMLEITYDNDAPASAYALAAELTGYQSVLNAEAVNEKYIEFYNPDHADVLGNPLAGLSDQVTVAFWLQGDPDFQPQNGTSFEAVTSTGARVLNSHTPWSDANVYWDAGNDGGYDRIYKASAPADYEGNWNYWTFTKNATTGSMKVYKNGVLWHSGSGLTKLMEGIDHLRLGQGNWGGSESYDGKMDEFAIWNTELDAATIAEYMRKDLDAAHPYAANLLLYYHFNDGDGITEPDEISGNDLGLIGAVTKMFASADLFRNATISDGRPMVRFEQGTFTSHLDSTLIITAVENDPINLVYYDPADPLSGTDTLLVWPGDYYTYNYNADGTIADSTYVPNTQTITNEDLPYYSAPFEVVNRYELGRYITPYGIGLDLGEGFTWTFDVSDYRPLLHDSVHLNAGNWQELLDVQFYFIEGTPPREVKSVTNLWSGDFGYGSTPTYDEQTPAKNVTIPADAANSRVKLRITGHGNGTSGCGEFCNKEHWLKVNGVTEWSQQVWRDNCDINPLYPQGGTWIFSRANWCPGAEVTTYDFELSPYVTPGNTYSLDYGAQDYTNNVAGQWPNYVAEVQLITYGPANFTNDAAITDIIAPTDDDMWKHQNPVCQDAIIRIQNTGSNDLTSLTIEYGFKGYEKATYNWTGDLKFMETEQVTMGNFPWSATAGNVFEVTVSDPNGIADEYEYNNTMTSVINLPPSYPNDIILEFKTNNKPNENDLFVYNQWEEPVLEHTDFDANTIYKDTLHLNDGCYSMKLIDYGGDGLNFWYYPADGSGYFKVWTIDHTLIKTYGADFGAEIYQQFVVGNYLEVNDQVDQASEVNVYPNPAQDQIFIYLNFHQLNNVEIDLIDATGKLVHSQTLNRTQKDVVGIDVQAMPSGIYFAVVRSGNEVVTRKFVIEK